MEVREVVTSEVGTKDGVDYKKVWKYPFLYSDGGRSESRRPKQKNDCTVRAVAVALNEPYDTVYEWFKGEGRKCSKGFHIKDWLAKDGRFEKIPFPAIKGQKRMNPSKFCGEFKRGKYICRTAKHVFAVIDGVVHDTWEQRPDRCIYTAWEVR